MPSISDPLTQQQKDEIDKSISDGIEIEAAIKKAQSTGIESDVKLEDIREKLTRLRAMKRSYGNA